MIVDDKRTKKKAFGPRITHGSNGRQGRRLYFRNGEEGFVRMEWNGMEWKRRGRKKEKKKKS